VGEAIHGPNTGAERSRGVALVTGAGSGFGLLIALELARAGYTAVAGVRTPAKAAGLLAQAEAEGLDIRVLTLDLNDLPALEVAAAGAESMGPVEVLVHNAGVCLLGAVEHLQPDELQQKFATNVFGVVALTRALLPAMRARGRGRIIAISSGAVYTPLPMLAAYAASKAALDALMEGLSLEVRAHGIAVTTLHPGVYRTGFIGHSDWTANQQGPGSPYAAAFAHVQRRNAESIAAAKRDPRDVARTVCRVALAPSPPLRATLDADAKLTQWLSWLLPRRWLAAFIARYLGV